MSIRTMLSSESNSASASALASSVFPTPVGPRKMNEPVGRFGSFTPDRARMIASATCCTASSSPTPRRPPSRPAPPPVEHLVEAQQLLPFALRETGYRDAGPHRDDLGDLLRR